MLIRTYARRNKGSKSQSENGSSQESPWDSQDLLFSPQDPEVAGGSDEQQVLSGERISNWPASEQCEDGKRRDLPTHQDPVIPAALKLMPAPAARREKSRALANSSPYSTNPFDSKRKAEHGVHSRKLLRTGPSPHLDGNGGKQGQRAGISKVAATETSSLPKSNARVTGYWSTLSRPTASPSSTLMEAQESGEMIEHVDEAQFAMDGLRKEQPIKVQRASLATMAQLCGTADRRRLLRTHGLAKPLVEAVVDLPADDPPLALAAAAVLHFLASDGHEQDLLDSSRCIQFLLSLLNPKGSLSPGAKPLRAGQAGTNARVAQDKSAKSVTSKIRDLFVSRKDGEDWRASGGSSQGALSNGLVAGREVSAPWLALLTLESACASAVLLEDVGAGDGGGRSKALFKEKLREMGGLDDVCQLASSCVSELQSLAKAQNGTGSRKLGQPTDRADNPGGVGMLLRCLRVMENVTFLSDKNQAHLMKMRIPQAGSQVARPFVAVVLDSIRVLAAWDAPCASQSIDSSGERWSSTVEVNVATNESHLDSTNCTGALLKGYVEDSEGEEEDARKLFAGSAWSCGLTMADASAACLRAAGEERSGVDGIHGKQDEAPGRRVVEEAELDPFAQTDGRAGEEEVKAPPAVISGKVLKAKGRAAKEGCLVGRSCGESASFDSERTLGSHGRRPLQRKPAGCAAAAQPPGNAKAFSDEGRGVKVGERERGGCMEGGAGAQWWAASRERQAVVEECLISAVKVLMNLTNDSPTGCRQVAASDGLHTIVSLAVSRCPVLALHSPLGRADATWPDLSTIGAGGDGAGAAKGQRAECAPAAPAGEVLVEGALDRSGSSSEHEGAKGRSAGDDMAPEEVDLLVVVLGVLVNLVERDLVNRSRLATLRCPLPSIRDTGASGCLPEESEGREVGVLQFLCALFLSKQGAGEAAMAAEKRLSIEMDEDEMLQGQKEAENMMVEAYAALLLAFLSTDSASARKEIALLLPGGNLQALVPVLEHFNAFHQSLNTITADSQAAVQELIDACRATKPAEN